MTKTRIKVSIPTARPPSTQSSEASIRTEISPKMWRYKSPVYFTSDLPSTAHTSTTSSVTPVPPGRSTTSSVVLSDPETEQRQEEETDSDCLSEVISGVCLLNSIDQMRVKRLAGHLRGVKSVLHRPI
eukprot:sb/3475424/